MLKRSAGALSLAFTFYNSQDSAANFSLNIGQSIKCAGVQEHVCRPLTLKKMLVIYKLVPVIFYC